MRQPSLSAATRWLVPVALTVMLARFLLRAGLALEYPYGIDYMEGVVLDYLRQTLEQGHYFPEIRTSPLHASYPPLFSLVSLPLYAVFGPGLWLVRLPSILSVLGTAWVLHRVARQRANLDPFALSVALLAFAAPFVHTWGVLARVDTLAVALSLLGLHLFDRARGPRDARTLLAFLCFALAFFTKHNFVLAPAAVFLSLLLRAERRRELPLALLLYLAPVALLTGAALWWTDGQLFLHLVSYTAVVPIDLEQALAYVREFVLLVWPLLLAAAAAIVLAGRLGVGTHPFALYWGLTLLALVSIGKDGANTNYFLEPYFATLALLGLAGRRLSEARAPVFAAWPAAFALALLWLVALGPRGIQPIEHELWDPAGAYEQVELAELVERTDGAILSEDVAALAVRGRPVLLEPFQLAHLADAGLWDPTPLLVACREGRFALVIASWRIQRIPGMQTCLTTRYRRVRTLGRYQIFEPR